MSEATPRRWLPEFCSLPTLFAVMIVAELVALVVVLAPDPSQRPWLPRLGVASVYVQWLALLNAVALCSMRQPLERLTPRAGFIVAWLVSITVTVLGSLVVWQMDQALGLGLTAAPGQGLRFLLGNAVVAALISAALLRYLFVLELWQERVEAASKAQVDALQARIRPHFLFNSMNTIAALTRSNPARAEEAVQDLADLFRANLSEKRNQIPLSDEIDVARTYQRMEQLRLGDRLNVEWKVDSLPRDALVPGLTLQPLLENAIYHGVEPRPDGGTVTVTGEFKHGMITVVVRNPVPLANLTVRDGNRLALANIKERMDLMYGERATVKAGRFDEEYIVTLRFPFTPAEAPA